ncbi:hypothetical protein ACFE04_023201 [Oxalis oulophora]
MSTGTLELLAEVTVLEEEVVRLEEQVVNFRQGLYQEAVYTSTKRNVGNVNDSMDKLTAIKSKHQRSKSLCQNEFNFLASPSKPQSSLAQCSSCRKLLPNGRRVYETGYDSVRPVNGKESSPKYSTLSLRLGDGMEKEILSCANSLTDKKSPDKKNA